MAKSKDLTAMRACLIETYPSGYIRGQLIADMPEGQVYAIYKSHLKRKIPMNGPRIKRPEKQIPGQLNILSQM